MMTHSSRIEICGDSNRVERQKPRALKPYMNDEAWERLCNDLDDAMQPWVALTRLSSRIARALGGMFLVFVIVYTAVKVTNLTAAEVDITAYVLFPMLMFVVAGSTCWLIRVLPQTNGLVVERIERALEGATNQVNEHMQHTRIAMEYQEDEVNRSNGKSIKWIQIRIVNEHGEVIQTEEDHHEEGDHLGDNDDGSFTLV
ncbi:unnamed protein product [Cylindrotheca closterium]|uniref:Uncharacterized protein n=1 Tax=Cylindrotheca closterium TaxID=2856 RepID=A0AAD2CE45_9STRA|nr:unnamed protein product [Cylindrotheca closterium]